MAGVLSYAMTLDSGGFTGPMNRAQGSMDKTGRSAGGLLSKLSSMVGPMAAVAAGVGAMTVAKKAFNAAADFEATTTSFATLLGSAEKADTMMQRIKDTAATTPNTFNELTGAARSLLAVSTEEGMVDDLRMIGDLASASQKPIGELGSMYAKILGGDQVQAEDLNMIGDALGGKALDEFAKVLGVDSVKAVRKLGSEGKITGKHLKTVFTNLTSEGGMAFGAMEAQSKTTRGLLSTLKDAADDIFLTLGQPINDMIKPMLKEAIVWAQAFGKTLKFAIEVGKNAAANGDLGEILFRGFQIGIIKISAAFLGMFEGLGHMVGNFATIAMDKLPTILGGKGKSETISIMDGVDFSGKGSKDLFGLDLAEESFRNLLARNAPDVTTITDAFSEIKDDAQATANSIQDAAAIANGGAGGGGVGGRGAADEEDDGKIRVFNQEESLKRRFDRMSKADKERGGFDDFYDFLGHYGNIGDQTGGIGGADRGALDAFMREQGGGDVVAQQDRLLGMADQFDGGGGGARAPRAGGARAAGNPQAIFQQIRDGIFAVRDHLDQVVSA